MAYCRLGHIKENKGTGGASKGLKNCIEYIFNPRKTNNGAYVGAYNLTLDSADIVNSAYDTMINTKVMFGKTMGRQGYHYKLSFKEDDDVTPEMALEITNEFCKRVFTDYECAYSVHDNTEHLHSHIVFNSIDMLDGYKYQYKKGDWAKKIMPVANDICKKYNLSALDLNVDEELRLQHKCKDYGKWSADKKKNKDKRLTYSNAMIKCDVDEAIQKAASFDEFVNLLQEKGHIVDTSGKYITVLAPERDRPCRLYNLTQDKQTYTKENIEKMINGVFIDRKELVNKMMQEWVVYNNSKNRMKISGLSKKMAMYWENQKFVVEKNIMNNDELLAYKEYLDLADKELNIMRRYISRALDAKRDIFEKMDVIVSNLDLYNSYKSTGDINAKTGYETVLDAFKYIDDKGYSLSSLYKYRVLGESLLNSISDYKKHIFVEKKICSRIERYNNVQYDLLR